MSILTGPPRIPDHDELADASDEELARLVEAAVAQLARRPSPGAATLLVGLLPRLGAAVGAAQGWQLEDALTPAAPAAPPAPAAPSSTHTLHAFREPTPGPRWRALFDATWPAYRAWYLQDGEPRRPDLATARARLVEHMPELVPTWETLVALTGGDPLAARMLTMWDTPAFAPACSQAVLAGAERALVRNYDYSPELFEWVSWSSALTGRRVIGTSDCLWGLLDGMNEDGLVVSLTFGGRAGSGEGFAIPLVVRYLLETATTVAGATDALARIPVSMSYNLTITDRSGATVTAYVAPGAAPEVSGAPLATNHRGTRPEDAVHARRYRSVERQQHLQQRLAERPGVEALLGSFLSPSLLADDYAHGFGTLYTALYRPEEGVLEYHWPGRSFVRTFASPDATAEVVLAR